MSTYRVAEGTQVHHDGVTYGPGETVQAAAEVAAPWLASGWVTEARKVETKPAKKVTRK